MFFCFFFSLLDRFQKREKKPHTKSNLDSLNFDRFCDTKINKVFKKKAAAGEGESVHKEIVKIVIKNAVIAHINTQNGI